VSEARVRIEAAADAAGVHLEVLSLAGDPDRFDAAAVDRWVARAVEAARAGPLDPDVVRAVRQMLKFGRYRATGRGKPAQEFLHKAASQGGFPRVFGAVDVLNAVSLSSALPMSLVDLDAAGTTEFRLRRGRADESYVFNTAGQSIDLRDLLLLATAGDDRPCANPVKDAMRTKLGPTSRRFAAVIYAPAALLDRAESARAELEAAYAEAWPSVTTTSGTFSAAAE
jgi:DNA/RNA-binding domain of Phe-tRNA-synthetase-like protein